MSARLPCELIDEYAWRCLALGAIADTTLSTKSPERERDGGGAFWRHFLPEMLLQCYASVFSKIYLLVLLLVLKSKVHIRSHIQYETV